MDIRPVVDHERVLGGGSVFTAFVRLFGVIVKPGPTVRLAGSCLRLRPAGRREGHQRLRERGRAYDSRVPRFPSGDWAAEGLSGLFRGHAALGVPAVRMVVRPMTDQVVGRESELKSIYVFLDAPAETVVGLVLEGEPGIGKSTLWLARLSAARERGLRVSRPVRRRPSAASHMSGSEICSRTCSTTSCRSCPRRGGGRSRPRSS